MTTEQYYAMRLKIKKLEKWEEYVDKVTGLQQRLLDGITKQGEYLRELTNLTVEMSN